MPTLYLTEDYALVRREGADCCWCRSPKEAAKTPRALSRAPERVPLLKIDEVIVLGEITLTASAIHALMERDI